MLISPRGEFPEPRRVSPVEPKVYRVPYRFGIGSMMMITVVFALVFAVMRAVGFGVPAVLLATAFLMAVGVAQSRFENAPRQASAITGGLLYSVFSVIHRILTRAG